MRKYLRKVNVKRGLILLLLREDAPIAIFRINYLNPVI